jgi:hypothetical protein
VAFELTYFGLRTRLVIVKEELDGLAASALGVGSRKLNNVLNGQS